MKNVSPTDEYRGPELLHTKLSEIHGVHPSILLLEEELKIPPLKLPSKYATLLSMELTSMLSRKPPIVFKDGRLRCVGNVRLFKTVKSILPPDTLVNCIEIFDLTVEQIRTDHLTELLFDSAVFGIHASDLSSIAQAARSAMKMELWNPPTASIEDYLSKLYCVDKRTLKPGALTSGADLEAATDAPATSASEIDATGPTS